MSRNSTASLPHTPGFRDESMPVASNSTVGPRHGTPLRRPLLLHLRQARIESLAVLEPFFARVSLATFEAVYASEPVDWQAVEASIERDMFEG
jgi:hypothetical protein